MIALTLVATLASSGSGFSLQASDAQAAPGSSAGTQSTESPFRFAVIGDQGQFEHQDEVARLMCRTHTMRPFNPVITTGDNVGPDGDPALFPSKFYRPYACLFERGVRWHASLGNHDFYTRRGLPEINEPRFGMNGRNYVVRIRGIRFVIWDSNTHNLDWLQKATVAQAGDRWTIVVFHHPLISGNPHVGGTVAGGALATTLPALFERRDVDLVLNGSHHIFSVSRALDGIRYVVTGGGSGSADSCDPSPRIAVCKRSLHFLTITVGDRYLWVRQVPLNGSNAYVFRTAGRR